MSSSNSKFNIEGVKTLYGKIPGKTLAVFAGVHGNERAGVFALEHVYKNCRIKRGIVHFVYASPLAIKKSVRFVEKNLNRCFLSSLNGNSYEEKRARELMPILDESDALLDVHASNNEESIPFVICEKKAWDVAHYFNIPIISFGWDSFEPGATDGYMYRLGKPGICLECGPAKDYKKFIRFAEKSIYQLLQFYGVVDSCVDLSISPKRYIKVVSAIFKQTESLRFTKAFADFEPLVSGQIFAIDGNIKYKAQPGQCIIFPHAQTPLGHEACIIGKEVALD